MTRGHQGFRAELARQGIRAAQAARELRVSKPTVGEWLAGKSQPSDENKVRIEIWSQWRVRASDWLETVPEDE